MPSEPIKKRLLDTASKDIGELLPHLEPRANELAEIAIDSLRNRGVQEERTLRQILERQRDRVREELEKHEGGQSEQLRLNFRDEETLQLEADMRSWRVRLEQFDRDLEREPQRVREFYEVRARRIEPVGLVYLWPETN